MSAVGSPLGTDYRSWIAVLVPGAFAMTPFVVTALIVHDELRRGAGRHEGVAAVVFAVACLTAGMLIDQLGILFERFVLDKFHDDPDRLEADWMNYLRVAPSVEPVGQRYIRSALIEFKLTLGLFIAYPVCAFGMSLLLYVNDMVELLEVCLLLLAVVATTALGLAADRSFVLASIRNYVLAGVGEPGKLTTCTDCDSVRYVPPKLGYRVAGLVVFVVLLGWQVIQLLRGRAAAGLTLIGVVAMVGIGALVGWLIHTVGRDNEVRRAAKRAASAPVPEDSASV